eukprot:4381787-Prymnesium_polylepis.1
MQAQKSPTQGMVARLLPLLSSLSVARPPAPGQLCVRGLQDQQTKVCCSPSCKTCGGRLCKLRMGGES